MEPFLRWAGGKTWLRKEILDFVPKAYNGYHEPFVGGGSIFFTLEHNKGCYLSDLNPELIDTYKQVRDNVEKIITYLKKFKNTEIDYYKIRGSKFQDPAKRAARFIYLNMTSFNGIYRVNRQGVYNVPYGRRYTIDFVQEGILRLSSQKLQNTEVECLDFETALAKVKKNDFVFIDPPYTVAHSNNNFIGYNQKLFSLEDQYRLAKVLGSLETIGAKFVLTNAYHKTIKEIYSGIGKFIVLKRMSLIGGTGATRGYIKEYLVKNF
jgi:DNA adenine methylase